VKDVTVEVTEVGSDDQRREVTLADGCKALTGKTLRAWLDQFGGPHGHMESPAGQVEVDLSPWLGRDPDTTVLHVRVRFVDPKKIGTRPGS
jgi:hypothetical protein